MSEEKRRDIVKDYYKADGRFRLAQGIFMLLVIVGLLFVIGAQQRTLTGITEQLRRQTQLSQDIKSTAARQDKSQTTQLNTLNRHLDCIVEFFRQPNRADVTIQDINNCSLDTSGNELSLNRLPSSGGGNTIIVPSSPQTIVQRPSGVSSPQTGTNPTTPTEPPTQPPVTPQPPTSNPQTQEPLEILGIPVCVPLLGICVSH